MPLEWKTNGVTISARESGFPAREFADIQNPEDPKTEATLSESVEL